MPSMFHGPVLRTTALYYRTTVIHFQGAVQIFKKSRCRIAPLKGFLSSVPFLPPPNVSSSKILGDHFHPITERWSCFCYQVARSHLELLDSVSTQTRLAACPGTSLSFSAASLWPLFVSRCSSLSAPVSFSLQCGSSIRPLRTK